MSSQLNRPIIRLLLVEDNDAHVELITRNLEQHKDRFQLTVAESIESARPLLEQVKPDLVIADMRLPDGLGTDLLAPVNQSLKAPMIIMTSQGNEEMAVRSMKLGASDYIVKSETTFSDMARIVERTLREWDYIQEAERANEALRQSEYQYRTVINAIMDIMYVIDTDYRIVLCNDALRGELRDLGQDENVIGKKLSEVFSFLDSRMLAEYRQVFESGQVLFSEDTVEVDGKIRFSENRRVPILSDGRVVQIVTIIHETTGRRTAEEVIKRSLAEKEVLLQEIHHRVKNNMQVINSLLRLQADQIGDERFKVALQESQNRVFTMSAVHETLLKSDNINEINLKYYLGRIVSMVFQSFASSSGHISIKNDICDLEIGINQASHLGLIVNELVTNALKYAFPGNRKGEITVKAEVIDDDILLTVRDNGIGISAELLQGCPESLGMQLVRTLAENQLEGVLAIDNQDGTTWKIRFNRSGTANDPKDRAD